MLSGNYVRSRRADYEVVQILAMKEEMERRLEQVKKKEKKTREAPDIVVKVVCKYRAELLFKISRKAKLSRLFNTWTERMESMSSSKNNDSVKTRSANGTGAKSGDGSGVTTPQTNFVFLHLGRTISPDQTPEELDMEGGDEILAVEMMDLTDDSAVSVNPTYDSGEGLSRFSRSLTCLQSNGKQSRKTGPRIQLSKLFAIPWRFLN